MNHRIAASLVLAMLTLLSDQLAAEESSPSENVIRAAVTRALPLLERASAGSADQRTCFTCHSQALPVIAMVESQRRGFHANAENLRRQVNHTFKHLRRGRKSYQEGKGQGGGVDTAGYALWTLEDGQHQSDDVTTMVTDWLLHKQHRDGFWKCSSNRPPSEASNLTTTYLALRALHAYGTEQQGDAIVQAYQAAESWLATAEAPETEDQVFQLLSFGYVDVPDSIRNQAVARLINAQRSDGGWAQRPDLDSDAYATATALYALREAGAIDNDHPVWTRAASYLLDHQLDDGSWYVKSRSKPFQKYFETGFPHRADQFISTTATAWATIALLQSLPADRPGEIAYLPGTKPLDWPEADLSQRLMDTAHTFVETQIAEANAARQPVRGGADRADHRRQELAAILGLDREQRSPPRMEQFRTLGAPVVIAANDAYQIDQVRWPVFANVCGEGLLLRQRENPIGRVLLIPDANQNPEQMLEPLALRLADNGFDVVVMAVVSRDQLKSDDRRINRADYSQREWIYRQAFHMGRHLIGYEIQRALAAVDWFASRDDVDSKIGILGYGEGGLIALHAAAIDPRIDTALVSGYFDSSDAIWKEPIYRNVWARLKRFGNAEVASLVAPRNLIIEHSPFPEVSDHKGALTTPAFDRLKSEFDKIPRREDNCKLVCGADGQTVGCWSDDALNRFASHFGLDTLDRPIENESDALWEADPNRVAQRQQRTTDQLETHVQSLVRRSEHVRDQFFLYEVMPEFNDSRWSTDRVHPTVDAERFVEASKSFRRRFHQQAMGRFDLPLLPPNPRTRKVAETDDWTAYDVVLDVHQGLFSWGVLVLPKDLQPAEKRPVVVCQHGRNAIPRDTIDFESTAYNQFAARLAERGFITFAPHNLYRGEDRYRWLDRKANAIGCTLFSFIIAQHDATLRWLDSLPMVDGDRIAFYGLSYGGETAVRVPTVLEKYCLSICSGDFNQWTRKVAATDQPFSFMRSIEWEMPYWDLGHTFDYAEMAYLMFPRPFMVERGHHDRVGRDRWVAHEFAKVRWLYAQFGRADQLEIEFFQGGHSINGEASFDFLHKHLDWPVR